MNLDNTHSLVKWLRILYPIWMVVGMFALVYIPSELIVSGDASETAKNIVDNEGLFRVGIVGGLVTQLFQIVVVILLYKLFKKTDADVAMLLLIFALVGVPISMLNILNQVAAITLVKGGDYLSSFNSTQLEALSMFFIDLQVLGMYISELFWGLWLLPLGYLAYKSMFFPKFVGIATIIGGVGYFLNGFVHLLIGSGDSLDVLELLFTLMTVGEMVFILWLLIKGIRQKPGIQK